LKQFLIPRAMTVEFAVMIAKMPFLYPGPIS
jgi:hypothetical protein